MSKVKIIDLEGTPFERGFQHGSLLAGEINLLYDNWLHKIKEKMHNKMSDKEIMSYSNQHDKYLKKYAPDLGLEMQGIADGANSTYERILFLNCFAEMERLIIPQIASLVGKVTYNSSLKACTCFAVFDEATKDRNVFIGQNWDIEDLWEPIILRIKGLVNEPKHTLLFSNPGLVGASGMNSFGLAICNTGMVANDHRVGLPYPFVVRQALQNSNLSNLLNSIIEAKRTTGIGYMIGTLNAAVSLQTTATLHSFCYPQNGMSVLGNHYEQFDNPSTKADLLFGIDSLIRTGRMKQLLKNMFGDITIDYLMDVLKDHENYPESICRHRIDNSNSQKTIAALIYDLSNCCIYITNGNPCEKTFIKIPMINN